MCCNINLVKLFRDSVLLIVKIAAKNLKGLKKRKHHTLVASNQYYNINNHVYLTALKVKATVELNQTFAF